jgi:orotidine-5'-phosphate decarboxylase
MTLLALALDTPDRDEAVGWARLLGPHVDVMKIGLQLFISAGPDVVGAVRGESGRPVFLDLKLDDIPKTVAGAAAAAARLGIGWLTVHTGAGLAACEAAVSAAHDASTAPPQLLGVTLLTSLGSRDMKALGMEAGVEGVVDRRSRLAAAAGMDGVVCAGTDLATVAAAAPALFRVVPGVRVSSAPVDDQSRIVTAADAARGGADLVVVGRPITRARHPDVAAQEVRGQLSGR